MSRSDGLTEIALSVNRFALSATPTLDVAAIGAGNCGYKEAQRRANALGRDTTEVAVMPAQPTTKCPACGSPDPDLRGGSCEHHFHDPKPRSRPSSGRLTAYLLSRGWERSDAEYPGECGESSDTVGYCEKPARWTRSNPNKHPMCAQHAMQAQRYIDRFETPRLP